MAKYGKGENSNFHANGKEKKLVDMSVNDEVEIMPGKYHKITSIERKNHCTIIKMQGAAIE